MLELTHLSWSAALFEGLTLRGCGLSARCGFAPKVFNHPVALAKPTNRFVPSQADAAIKLPCSETHVAAYQLSISICLPRLKLAFRSGPLAKSAHVFGVLARNSWEEQQSPNTAARKFVHCAFHTAVDQRAPTLAVFIVNTV